MNVNVDFSIYGIELNMTEYDKFPFDGINKVTKKEEKEVLKNLKYPIIIINPIFDQMNSHLIDHVSIGVRNKD
jgi:hypothetical protein